MPKHKNWRPVLDTLLNNSSEFKYDLEVINKELVITTDSVTAEKIKQRLDDVLPSKNKFMQNMPYIVINKNEMKLPDENDLAQQVPPPEHTVNAAKNIFLHLFGDKPFQRWHISIDDMFNENQGAHVESGILYLAPLAQDDEDDKITLQLLELMLKQLVKRFNGISATRARQAWLEDNSPLLLIESDKVRDGQAKNEFIIAEGLLNGCFGRKSNCLFFDFQRLHEILFPPYISLENVANKNEATIKININHLDSYLSQMASNGILLRIYKNSEQAAAANGQLIILDRAPALTKPNKYTFILDRSSSMENAFDSLKEKALEFVKKILSIETGTIIRFRFFSDKADEPKEFEFQNKEQTVTMNEIQGFLQNVAAHGETRLTSTVYDEIAAVPKQPDEQNYNHVFIVFTDGIDNCEQKPQKELEVLLESFNPTCTPKPVAIGLGDVNSEMLGNLVATVGGTYHQIDEVEDIQQILEPVTRNTMRHLKDVLIELINKQNEHELIFSGKLVQAQTVNAEPQLPDITIPFRPKETIKLTLGDAEIKIQLNPQSKIAVANGGDLLREIAQEARRITKNSNKSDNSTVIAELHNLQERFNNLRQLLSKEYQEDIQEVDKELNTYTNQFIKAKKTKNEGYSTSASILAGFHGAVINSNKPATKPASHSTSLNTNNNIKRPTP